MRSGAPDTGDSTAAPFHQRGAPRQLARRQRGSRRSATPGLADTFVEAEQHALSDVHLAAEIHGSAHLVARQEPADLFAALQVDGGDVLVAPGHETDTAPHDRIAEQRRELEAGLDGTATSPPRGSRLLPPSGPHAEQREPTVVAGSDQLAALIRNAPDPATGARLEQDHVRAIGHDHDVRR